MSSQFKLKRLRRNARGRLVTGMREDLPFGIFGIDQLKLRDNTLSICRRTNRKKVNGFKNRKISNTCKLVVLEMLQGLQPQSQLMNEMTSDEYAYLDRVVKASQIDNLELPKPEIPKGDIQLKRELYVNIGQMESGNDSEELKTLTRKLMKEIKRRGLLNDYQLNHISSELKL
jgi:hypothetical protein